MSATVADPGVGRGTEVDGTLCQAARLTAAPFLTPGVTEIFALANANQLPVLLAHETVLDLGPPPGTPRLQHDVPFARALTYLAAAWGNATARQTAQEPSIEALDTRADGPGGRDGIAIAAAILATPQIPVSNQGAP